jgi:hypothetical protein
MEPPFAFSATYDADSARVAARTLFIQMWRPLLPFYVLSPVVGVGGMVFFGAFGLSDLVWLMAGLLLLTVLSSGYLYWSMTRRIASALAGTAQFNLTDTDLGVSRQDRGSGVLPWKVFKFARRDARNLLLFVSNRVAIVIPLSALSDAALNFVTAHVPLKR